MKLFALVDCNSFYCSCERAFRPDTRGRPVLVLSNNDGCAIALSKEARALDFKMGEPFYQLKERIKKHNAVVFSSNYPLYDNMSRRVMEILGTHTTHLEIYSVDEAFLEMDGLESFDLESSGRKIREEVLRVTGIPVGIGIAPTKVLAKMANRLSKNKKGLCIMTKENEIDRALKDFPIKNVWGVGRRSAVKFNMLGIKTAWDLKMFRDDKIIQKIFTKTGRQVQEELRGVSCLEVNDAEDKEHIGTSRSFGAQVYSKSDLKEAIAEFCTHATKKLRTQESVCHGLSVFIHTNVHKDKPQYYGQESCSFLRGTSDAFKIIEAAHKLIDQIYRPGFEYKKGGVFLNHIVPRTENQLDIFSETSDDNEKLNSVMDLINKKYGAQTIKSAACGLNQHWRTIAEYKSSRYTTSWEELLKIGVSDLSSLGK